MTERIRFWQRAAPEKAVAKLENRHATQVAKAKDRVYGRGGAPRVDAATKARASSPKGSAR